MATRTAAAVPAAEITAEEFAAGVPFETLGRTITEGDVMTFAGLTGDQNPQHTDREWAAAHSMFGQRIAHGLLVTSIAVGMVPPRIRAMGRPVASQGVFKKPVFFGDTIRVVGRVLPHRARPGVPTPAEWRVVNQDDGLVAKVRWDYELEDPSELVVLDGPLTPAIELGKQDLRDGVAYRTAGRTLTEAHVTGFAAITGDWHPEHTDAIAAAQTELGVRSVHPLLLISTASGMIPLDVPRLVAARRAQFHFHRPLPVGGTMYVEGRMSGATPIEDGVEQEVHEYRCRDEHGELLSSLVLHLLLRDQG